jgi:hypothetical protein
MSAIFSASVGSRSSEDSLPDSAEGAAPPGGGRRLVVALHLLEDGVLLELLLDDVDQLQSVHLQQLDRLLQLRGHDQLLGQA